MGMRAAQNFAMQHPGKCVIGAVLGAPGHLVDTVMPNRAGTDNPETILETISSIRG
jgi:hypothetical protein